MRPLSRSHHHLLFLGAVSAFAAAALHHGWDGPRSFHEPPNVHSNHPTHSQLRSPVMSTTVHTFKQLYPKGDLPLC
uniref:Secreted protein n=1 Tax=Physcomitrium patens TaxID=3218 RepID=A0A2K1KB82_PHYPA|nr:hypothetical protein PHYPA_010216 [Physcomitrium patens]